MSTPEPQVLPEPHTATIGVDGATNLTHPDSDPPDCDFESYLTADWSTPHHSQLGAWWFFRMDNHWNGTPQPQET